MFSASHFLELEKDRILHKKFPFEMPQSKNKINLGKISFLGIKTHKGPNIE
jgi:hypothetical protein